MRHGAGSVGLVRHGAGSVGLVRHGAGSIRRGERKRASG